MVLLKRKSRLRLLMESGIQVLGIASWQQCEAAHQKEGADPFMKECDSTSLQSVTLIRESTESRQSQSPESNG